MRSGFFNYSSSTTSKTSHPKTNTNSLQNEPKKILENLRFLPFARMRQDTDNPAIYHQNFINAEEKESQISTENLITSGLYKDSSLKDDLLYLEKDDGSHQVFNQITNQVRISDRKISALEFMSDKKSLTHLSECNHENNSEKPSKNVPKIYPDEKNSFKISKKNYLPENIFKWTLYELELHLISQIVFEDDNILALNKPYGVPIFKQGSIIHSISECLPAIAKHVGVPKLSIVHRLDRTTTGVLILAKNPNATTKMSQLFASRSIEKNYLAITNGVPKVEEGLIDIPLCEEKVGQRYRMALKLDRKQTILNLKKKRHSSKNVKLAETIFCMISEGNCCSLLNVKAKTGYKHQIRLHLGFGISTPILGDHKYSHINDLGKPQKIKGPILDKLRMSLSESRKLPVCLHAKEAIIPWNEETIITVSAEPPNFFRAIRKSLKLKMDR